MGGGSFGGGGGHMGGSSFGGGHIGGGGFSGGHVGSFGGTQHQMHQGATHFGGQTQSAPSIRQFSQPSVNHGGFNAGHVGTIHNNANSFQGTHSNVLQGGTGNRGVLNGSGSQHLGTTMHQQQHNAPFYQQHGANRAQTLTGNATTTRHLGGLTNGTNSQHGSQFLQQHAAKVSSHNAGQSTLSGAASHRAGLTTASLNNSFLSQHHAGNLGTNHHSANALASNKGPSLAALNHHHTGSNLGGSGLNHGTHHGGNGSQNQNTIIQNFNYGNRYYGGSRYWYGNGFGYGGFGYGGFGSFGFYRPSCLGFGFGRFPYLFGLGLGSGLGYGGYGYGGYGYNNYGYSGYGYGLGYSNCCFSYQPVCAYQPISYGYASALPGLGGYSSVGLGLGAASTSYSPVAQATVLGGLNATPTDAAVTSLAPQLASADPKANAGGALPSAEEYAQIGESSFKARDYKSAVRAWRHGIVDDPENGVLVLMLAQGMFATEQFNESAGATQFAMQSLPSEKWDVVVRNYRELYGRVDDYTAQLKALEKAAKDKTDDPGLRFLLGYHYGFLGYPKEAVVQLEKCLSLAPEDDMAQKLLNVFQDKLPKSDKKEELPAPGLSPSADAPAKGKLPTLSTLVPPPVPDLETAKPRPSQPTSTNDKVPQ